MTDSTTPQDDAAMSPASTGSVGEPVAWAALRDDGDIAWIGFTPDGAADGACGRQIVPLYRSPTLTDAERKAVKEAADAYGYNNDDEGSARIETALRGVLERLG